jgi:hypothetical protein
MVVGKMKLKWNKFPSPESLAIDWERVFIIPTESGSVMIICADEFCTVDGYSVQELVAKFKEYNCNILWLAKTEIKTTIENILKENNNDRRP